MTFFSIKYSKLAIRLGLAFVFFWFGIDKFFHPSYWINAWIPEWTLALVAHLGIGAMQFTYLNGVFEVLIGLSLVSGVFLRIFSLLGVLFLLAVMIFVGFSEITVRDIGLLGGLISLLVWPERD